MGHFRGYLFGDPMDIISMARFQLSLFMSCTPVLIMNDPQLYIIDHPNYIYHTITEKYPQS